MRTPAIAPLSSFKRAPGRRLRHYGPGAAWTGTLPTSSPRIPRARPVIRGAGSNSPWRPPPPRRAAGGRPTITVRKELGGLILRAAARAACTRVCARRLSRAPCQGTVAGPGRHVVDHGVHRRPLSVAGDRRLAATGTGRGMPSGSRAGWRTRPSTWDSTEPRRMTRSPQDGQRRQGQPIQHDPHGHDPCLGGWPPDADRITL
jgi:hypothetical protein